MTNPTTSHKQLSRQAQQLWDALDHTDPVYPVDVLKPEDLAWRYRLRHDVLLEREDQALKDTYSTIFLPAILEACAQSDAYKKAFTKVNYIGLHQAVYEAGKAAKTGAQSTNPAGTSRLGPSTGTGTTNVHSRSQGSAHSSNGPPAVASSVGTASRSTHLSKLSGSVAPRNHPQGSHTIPSNGEHIGVVAGKSAMLQQASGSTPSLMPAQLGTYASTVPSTSRLQYQGITPQGTPVISNLPRPHSSLRYNTHMSQGSPLARSATQPTMASAGDIYRQPQTLVPQIYTANHMGNHAAQVSGQTAPAPARRPAQLARNASSSQATVFIHEDPRSRHTQNQTNVNNLSSQPSRTRLDILPLPRIASSSRSATRGATPAAVSRPHSTAPQQSSAVAPPAQSRGKKRAREAVIDLTSPTQSATALPQLPSAQQGGGAQSSAVPRQPPSKKRRAS